MNVLAWASALLIIVLNLYLLVQTTFEWFAKTAG